MKEKIKFVVGLLMFLGCVIYGAIITFSNPDMTEMRLMMTYWKEYIVLIAVGLIGLTLTTSGTNKK